MGDIKRHRKKYQKPGHPWQKERIDEEKTLLKEFGLKNKKEIWIMNSLLRNFTGQAKKLITQKTEQGEKEKQQLLDRLKSYGLINPEAGLNEVLAITLRDILERRLQTVVYKKMMANSAKQARQFITHGHVVVDTNLVTSPSYLVSVKEANMIGFKDKSSLADEEHPERNAARKQKEEESKLAEIAKPSKEKGKKPASKPEEAPAEKVKQESSKEKTE